MTKYIILAMAMFLIGLLGLFIARKNIIIILMCVELMLLAVNINFIVFSVYLDDIVGQVFSLLVLTVAAAEASIGLAILVVYYRVRGTIGINYISSLKG